MSPNTVVFALFQPRSIIITFSNSSLVPCSVPLLVKTQLQMSENTGQVILNRQTKKEAGVIFLGHVTEQFRTHTARSRNNGIIYLPLFFFMDFILSWSGSITGRRDCPIHSSNLTLTFKLRNSIVNCHFPESWSKSPKGNLIGPIWVACPIPKPVAMANEMHYSDWPGYIKCLQWK